MMASELMEKLRDIAHEQRRSMATLRVRVNPYHPRGWGIDPIKVKEVYFSDERGCIIIQMEEV